VPRAEKRQRKKENARAARAEREAAARRKKRNRTVITVAAVAAGFILFIVLLNVFFGGDNNKDKDKVAADQTTTTTAKVALPAGCVDTTPTPSTKQTYKEPPAMQIDASKTYVAKFETTCGDFEVKLDPATAPKTVNSFVFLAKSGFYDGLTFHRVAKDFVVQGGDPKGDGSGGPGYTLATEPPKNGYKKGSVAMANAGPDTTGSQFFIALTDQGAQGLGTKPPYLYSALGEVTKGFDVVQRLGSLYNPDQDPSDPSTQTTAVPLYMFKVTISES
jgi:cyclophilin family peptidyl-prolyl cis-trans isomerase